MYQTQYMAYHVYSGWAWKQTRDRRDEKDFSDEQLTLFELKRGLAIVLMTIKYNKNQLTQFSYNIKFGLYWNLIYLLCDTCITWFTFDIFL